MPWDYTIDTDKNAVFTTGTGVLTDQEALTGVMLMYADPCFNPDARGLFDYRGFETLKVSSEMMARLANQRRFSENSRTAFLVTGQLAFGLGRVYQSWVTVGEVKIFCNRDEAVAWLNEGYPPRKHIT